MKLLCFTDTHCNARHARALAEKAAAPGIDAILCAGDHTWFGQGVQTVMEPLARAGLPIYHVPGNHESGRTDPWMRMNIKLSFNVNGRWERLGGIFVCGFGGMYGVGEPNDDRLPPYGELEGLAAAFPEEVASGGVPFVFLTHYPPFGVLDGTEYGPQGSVQVRHFIESRQPALVVCGHLHAWAGRSDRIGKTRVVNPGPTGMVVAVDEK